MSITHESELAVCVRNVLKEYFRNLDGEPASDVYNMVLNNVEKPMVTLVLEQAGSNQSRAAEILGINRNTLRKKMQAHGIK